MTRIAWREAEDPEALHALVEACDVAAAHRSGSPAPARRFEKTALLVEQRWAHVGSMDGRDVVTITVGPVPSFDPAAIDFPPAERTWYQQRLGVHPACPEPLAGVQAVRHAITAATSAGADALRAEANPDLRDVFALLRTLGFVEHARDADGPVRRAFLQLVLAKNPAERSR